MWLQNYKKIATGWRKMINFVDCKSVARHISNLILKKIWNRTNNRNPLCLISRSSIHSRPCRSISPV